MLYHLDSAIAKDIDPQVEAIKYLCERFELNTEQRFWICFLYSTNYSIPTTYFIYNEFPDFISVDYNRLTRWWTKQRGNLIFTTDRRWVRSTNSFVPQIRAYATFVMQRGGGSQEAAIASLSGDFNELLGLPFPQFSRFSAFLYSELLYHVRGVAIEPPFSLAGAWSSEVALREILPSYFIESQTKAAYDGALSLIKTEIERLGLSRRYKTIWSIETSLCAFRKHVETGKRYVGYYIDRMRKEIDLMQSRITKGVCWTPLWDFRRETYEKQYTRFDSRN